MSIRVPLLVWVVAILVGCANPLNRATSDRYAQQCSEAYNKGFLDIAEEACYRAAVNVNLGNLGPEMKSERYYNLALVKRRLMKLNEAEELLRESLQAEEKVSGPSSFKAGHRLAELAAVEYQKAAYSEGLPLLERLEPIANQYSGQERFVVAVLFHCYAAQAQQANQPDLAARLNTASSKLDVVQSDFKCSP